MRRLTATLFIALYAFTLALGLYEITAKSPRLCGLRLPGWRAGDRAERSTAWRPVTGFGPLDHLLHESEEATRFYGYLLADATGRDRPAPAPAPSPGVAGT